MAGKWVIAEQEVVDHAISAVSSTQAVPMGSIVRGKYTGYASGSDNYGAGEFVYLKGVAATVVGNLVAYDPLNGTTTIATAGAHGVNDASFPMAVAMAATTAGTYGWYQISGAGLVRCTGSNNPAWPLFLQAASGAVGPGTVTGNAVMGLVALASSSTTTMKVLLNRPHTQADDWI